MTIVFFSNFLNHHQKLVADELYELTDHQYTFVETVPMYDWLKKGGYTDYSQEPYVLRAWENEENRQKAVELAKTSDVALFGSPEVLYLEVIRAKQSDKISFEVSERWLKRGWINLLSPRLLKNLWYYHTLFKKKPFYKLCASAFGAGDQYKLHSYKNRCYKWGYFTKVETCGCENPSTCSGQAPVEAFTDVSTSEITPLMWCSRFLMLKHPELPILMANRLKEKGYKFLLDMYGSGTLFERSKQLTDELRVNDVVRFCGNVPNEQILQAMREHEIFLFTSDQNEGWGAVANESMSNGCVLVGSDAIGSTPFLVKDGVNGMLFKSSRSPKGLLRTKVDVDEQALNSLTEKVEWLLNHPKERRIMAMAAFKSMSELWSPKNAAHSFLKLVDDLEQGRDSSITEGPCSKATPL